MKVNIIQNSNYIYSNTKSIPVSLTFTSGDNKDKNEILSKVKKAYEQIDKIDEVLAKADKYNSRRAASLRDSKISNELSKQKRGFLDGLLGNPKEDEIRSKYYDEYNYERFVMRAVRNNSVFLKDLKRNLESLIAIYDAQLEELIGVTGSSFLNRKTVIPPQQVSAAQVLSQTQKRVNSSKPQVSETTKNTSGSSETLNADKFHLLRKEWHSSSFGDPRREELRVKTTKMKDEMIEKNISFVPTVPEKFKSKEEQIKFLQTILFDEPYNEATALEVMDLFEKYGSRYTYGVEDCSDGMDNLSLFVSTAAKTLKPESADKVISRYLDLFDKFADITPPKNNDTRHLNTLIIDSNSVMSLNTVIKLIDTLKKWSFEQVPAWNMRTYMFNSEFNTRPKEELNIIDKHLKELEELVDEKYPFEDNSRQTGA